MINLFYILSYGIMIVWFPLFMNLIFTLFVKKTKNEKFKFRFGKAKGYENLNPIKSTGWVLITLIFFELSAIALNLIFFNELVNLLTLTRFNTIPIFLFTSCFFVFWITKKDIGASWKNKFVLIPFVIFLAIILIWGSIVIVLLSGGKSLI